MANTARYEGIGEWRGAAVRCLAPLAALLLFSLLLAACGSSRHHYMPENLVNLREAPVWLAAPMRIADRGDVDVMWESDVRDATRAHEMAEARAPARAVLYMETLGLILRENRAQAVDKVPIAEDATTEDIFRAVGSNVGGFMPVERWWDPLAKRMYVLLRMPAHRFQRLEAVWERKVLEDAILRLVDDRTLGLPR